MDEAKPLATNEEFEAEAPIPAPIPIIAPAEEADRPVLRPMQLITALEAVSSTVQTPQKPADSVPSLEDMLFANFVQPTEGYRTIPSPAPSAVPTPMASPPSPRRSSSVSEMAAFVFRTFIQPIQATIQETPVIRRNRQK